MVVSHRSMLPCSDVRSIKCSRNTSTKCSIGQDAAEDPACMSQL
jgi:hypothetical protein